MKMESSLTEEQEYLQSPKMASLLIMESDLLTHLTYIMHMVLRIASA